MSLDAAAVTAAARAWVYVPPGAPEVVTEEFRVVAFPTTWPDPTAAHDLESTRPAADLVDDVLAVARRLGRTDVLFWTHDGTRPEDLVAHLLERGAVAVEELAVLARPLPGPGGLPVLLSDLGVPDDVEVRAATDLASLRALDAVGVAVFGGTPSSDESLLAEHTRGLSTGLGVVARRDGEAVGAAGLTMLGDGVTGLWGGAVPEHARGTGVYRALLAHRLGLAVTEGATIALVKGRLTTSAPILARAGFATYGVERSYRLAVPG